jgi:hydroxymethylbilane synthase
MQSGVIVRIGARGSNLSRTQVEEVRQALWNAFPGIATEVVSFVTTGDIRLETPLSLIGGKGVFTSEIEAALRAGTIDLAVHSLKDLPVEDPDGITIVAIPERAPVADVLISRTGRPLSDLDSGAVVGTSSLRRSAQLRNHRPDIRTESIRGNVETRLRKLMDPDGPYDAIVLAQAGLSRLGLGDRITEVLDFETMLPAPGQGALAVQAAIGSHDLDRYKLLNQLPTALAVTAERSFLQALGGGCSLPVGAFAEWSQDAISIKGRVSQVDGLSQVDVAVAEPCPDAESAIEIGKRLAALAIEHGADVLLGAIR